MVAGLEVASGVMMLLDHALERRQAKQLAADSVRAAQLLTSLHLEDFPELSAPVAPVAQRSWRRLGRANIEEQAALDEEHARDVTRWEELCRHDPDEVIATVDKALADNASQSACIDAGIGPSGNYVTLVVHYPGLEITQGIVQVGASTRPRNEKERIQLYERALASTVIATAKEALACAPAANEAYVVVLRYDMRGRFSKKTTQLDAIYAGALGRGLLKIDWKTRSPVELMMGARAVRVNKDRKGRFRPLGAESGDDLSALVSAIANITQSVSHERPRRRRVTRDQSRELMRLQRQEPFVAVSACPACGEIDTHALRPAGKDDPDWAGVIRTCATCDRQWAQA